MKNSQLSDGHNLVFIVFFFIYLIAGRNCATMKCRSGAFVSMKARSSDDKDGMMKII